MATTRYVVLKATGANHGGDDHPEFYVLMDVGAANAKQACQRVASTLPDEDLDEGVTLVAVPARNWNGGRHTLKAETQRRIRSA